MASKFSLTSFKGVGEFHNPNPHIFVGFTFIFVSIPVLFTPSSWCGRHRHFSQPFALPDCTELRGPLRKNLYPGSFVANLPWALGKSLSELLGFLL